MITEVPAAIPLTVPVVDAPDTTATPVDAETHGLLAAARPEPDKVVLPSEHKVSVPEMVGKALTVTEVAVDVHPLLSV